MGQGAMFLDFSKAFDTVSHSLLVSKLRKYGLDECTTSTNPARNGSVSRRQANGPATLRTRTPPLHCAGGGPATLRRRPDNRKALLVLLTPALPMSSSSENAPSLGIGKSEPPPPPLAPHCLPGHSANSTSLGIAKRLVGQRVTNS
ncbi:unnamed protein product [Caretta caretta]